jgi:hypothetical protein
MISNFKLYFGAMLINTALNCTKAEMKTSETE